MMTLGLGRMQVNPVGVKMRTHREVAMVISARVRVRVRVRLRLGGAVA